MDVLAINLNARRAMRTDGELCEITNMLDCDGDETNDPEEALAVVVDLGEDAGEGRWAAVDVADFVEPVDDPVRRLN